MAHSGPVRPSSHSQRPVVLLNVPWPLQLEAVGVCVAASINPANRNGNNVINNSNMPNTHTHTQRDRERERVCVVCVWLHRSTVSVLLTGLGLREHAHTRLERCAAQLTQGKLAKRIRTKKERKKEKEGDKAEDLGSTAFGWTFVGGLVVAGNVSHGREAEGERERGPPGPADASTPSVATTTKAAGSGRETLGATICTARARKKNPEAGSVVCSGRARK